MTYREFPIPPKEESRRFFYGYLIVIFSFFNMIAVFGTYSAFGVFLKPLLREFGWTTAITTGAYSLSLVVFGLLGIITGRLNDKFGPRIVLSFGGLFLSLGYLLMSQISSVWHFYLLYGVIIGIGMSSAWVPVVSTVARWFISRRGLMTGIVIAGMGLGQLIIPPIATTLVLAYDWRISYLVLGSLVLVIVILVAQFLKRDPTQIGELAYGKNKGESHLGTETGALSFGEAVYTKKFWLALGIEFCIGFCALTIIVHVVAHTIELGISPSKAATVLATIGGLSILGRVILGSAGDKIGNCAIYILSFAIMSATLFYLPFAKDLWELYMFAVVFGFAYGGAVASESPLSAELFGLTSHGLIYGFLNFVSTIGASLGPLLAGYIYDVNGNYELAFFISGAIGILGLIFSATLRPIRNKDRANSAIQL